MAVCLGIDTSNYTTSVAAFDGSFGVNVGKLLTVPAGTLGLRQSEALFQHVKRLPEVFSRLEGACRESGLSWDAGELAAVGASTRPRAVEGSYMPCFLAGEGQGRVLSGILGIPFFPVSHQQGHLAAAAWSAGRLALLDSPMLAWHLSGGTTELLFVTPEGGNLHVERIGGTSDISAGQLIDRTGVLLGLEFPAGKALDALAARSISLDSFRVKCNDLTFSLSGVENKVKLMSQQGREPSDIAAFVLSTVSDVVHRVTVAAQDRYPGLPVLCSGGVASNTRLRYMMTEFCKALFAEPQYSTDNALGVAILAHRLLLRGSL